MSALDSLRLMARDMLRCEHRYGFVVIQDWDEASKYTACSRCGSVWLVAGPASRDFNWKN